jgi:hypothetical protein
VFSKKNFENCINTWKLGSAFFKKAMDQGINHEGNLKLSCKK